MGPSSEKYHPAFGGGSALRTHHHRCACGEIFPLQVVVAVDAQKDTALASRIAAAKDIRALNQCACPFCSADCFAEAPFTYHDARRSLLVLVLPESYRHRELEERAALLLDFATGGAPLPTYAITFELVYGPRRLHGLMEARANEANEAIEAEKRADRLQTVNNEQLEQVAAREQGLDNKKSELSKLTAELDARSSQLTELELSLRDRKAALDRRSGELEAKTQVIAAARESLRAESEAGLPAALQTEETQALSTDDILTSAPDPNIGGPLQVPKSASVSGSSVDPAPKPALRNLVDEETPEPILLEQKLRPPPARADSEVITDEQLPLKDTEPKLKKTGPGQSKTATATSAAVPTDPEVLAWCKRRGQALKLLRGHDVWLVASVPKGSQSELAASDIRALLQLHRMPTYPLVTLTLANAKTLGGDPGQPFSFHFDVGFAADREMLEQLAKSFRFRLETFDEMYLPLQQRRLGAPLATNVHFVVALALDSLREIPTGKRSFANAMKEFANPRYDRLGRKHALAREFKDSQLDKLSTALEVLQAIALCEQFSGSEGEEYLVAIRSYPFERWHQRRLVVIRKAIEIGLWVGPSLAQVAVSEGLVRSTRDLVARCQNHFATFVSMGGQGLASKAIDKNWAVLEKQALSLGIGGAGVGNDTLNTTGGDATQSEDELVTSLNDPARRLDAISELCLREFGSALEPISRALAELSASEAPAAFASFVKLGKIGTASLLVFLECPTPHLRHAASLAVCELRDEAGIDSICEALMTEEGSLWREYALALGQVGATAIMPVVARVSGKGKLEQARAVWALGYIAGQGGRKSVETLSNGKDVAVATVASSALELEARLRDGTIATERDPVQSQFSEAFYSCLSGVALGSSSAEISGQSMLLDEHDLLEASDP